MEELNLSTGFSNRAKIVEILKNLQSQEVNIYGHAAKEFIGLLNGEAGNGFLVELIQLSPDCTELMDAWRMHQNKPGMAHILSLLSTIIDHPAGKSKNVSVRKKVENFARLIVESKLDDIYSELNTRESKRQSAALNLLASVVKRGVGLASEVAKNFDFKLPALGKLSGVAKKGTRESKGREPKRSSRRAFVNFAMSFVESANPKLLRWILQQRELFSGVLRGISNDDADTVVYVLSLFRDKVLSEEYLIPPGLRSVLFGSATLEQLSYLSGNPEGGAAADVAHQVLLMVCTDQRNGLMPGPGLRGNEKRLFDLMKKLKATEVASHRELVLCIVCSSFSLCSAYFDEFPYHLEPRPSPSWISAISLVADIVSSLDINLLIASLTSSSDQDGSELVLKCITPQVCSRLILNKGLLHTSNLVRHGSLRLVLESLKILCGLIHALDGIASRDDNKKWASMKCCIQDEVRASLPDPQVLVKLLSSKRQKDSKISGSRLKRRAESEPTEVELKKKKTVMSTHGDDDIMIGGVYVEPAESGKIEEKEGSESMSQSLATVYEIWGIDRESLIVDEERDLEDIFQSKLLDVLTYYLRALPVSFDGTFDFIKIIPSDPSTLSSYEITSLLPLIPEYVLPGGDFDRIPESMYKHLQPLINIFLHLKKRSIRDQAYILVRAAMISTGAFEGNLWEIDCWFHFEQFFEASSVVIAFLCDAVSTLGNSLYKYMDQMRNLISDKKPGFSPLVLCILQKCLRLLDSESGSFKLYERSIISLYVCNTLSLILQSQVEMSMLPGLINSLLAEKLKGYSPKEKDIKLSLCEWRPLRNLFLLSQNVSNQQYRHMFTLPEISSDEPLLSKSLFLVLSKVGELINRGQVSLLPNIANSFLFSVICAKSDDLVENLPHVLSLAKEHFSSNFPFLALVLFLERDNLARIMDCWPELLFVGLRMLKDETLCSENVAGAFAKYLLESSFYTLFGTLLGCGYHADLIQSVELLELLRGKLSDRPVQEMTFCLRLVLFWGYHALSAYVSEPSDQLEGFSNLCFSLVEIIFDHLTRTYCGAETCSFMRFLPLELVDFLFEHPLITELLSSSLLSGDVLSNGGLDQLRAFSKENLPLVSRCLLRFLIKVYVFLEQLGSKLNLKGPKLLLKKIQLQFREMFEYCTEKSTYGHLLPVYCVLREFLPFVSSSELLNLANWMFSLVESKATVSGFGSEAGTALAFVSLQFADTAMEMLFRCDAVCNPFWDVKEEGFDFTNFQMVYYRILNSAFNLNLEFVDFFLYKAVERMYRCKYRDSITSSHFCLAVLSSNILTNSPLKLINYCILPSSKVKTRILELIIESSPTHLKLFGKLLIGLMQRDPCIWSLFMRSDDMLEDDFVNLLPAALVYVNKSGLKLAQEILAFYAEILLNGFSKWKGFVTRHGLTEIHNQSHEPEILSLDEFRGYFEKTLLGKAVSMLRHFFELNAASITKKQRLEIFDSIFPNSAEVIVSDLRKINSDSSIEVTTRLRGVIHAKVSLARLLLSDKTALQMHSKKINSTKQRFISILVNSLDRIVRNVQQKIECLEHFILHNIVEIWLEAQSYLVQLKPLSFLNTFIRSSLLHRFNDPFTLKSIRCICTCLAEGSCSANEILELLLGHSQFVTAFTCDSSDLYPSTLLQPVPSIFKSLNFSSDSKCSKLTHGNSVSEKRKLELVRLLRVLYHFKIKQNCKGLQDESKELLFLLLSVYGATLRDIDLEIHSLMQEVELSVGSNWGGIAEMDYLWGKAVTKVREEMKVELRESENGGIEDRRKFLFRENIPVDSKMCVATASNFCYERSLNVEVFSIEKLLPNSVEDFEMPSPVKNPVQGYDPKFILQFSINSLLMGYIEPIEFCRLGLLAITLVSMSSPDDELRKLGYESLATFKTSLENSGKGKEKMHIQLLLMYLQNGISEPWQKIASVVAIFAAEASFTLLDASQHFFFTISKFLMRTSSVNLKSIPLFHTLFQSSSIHFKSDRIWILQLLYAGLNLDDDAKIYKTKSILEHLLNFYSSSASDPESRFLILVIVKKSVKLPALLNHLLKECGLVSWLSSVLSIYGEGIDSDNKHSAIVELVLEVVNASLSSRTVTEWLQDTALEQLSQMSSYLFKHLTRDRYSLTEHISLVNAMLQVIVSTLRLSQKRKIYQPHFTFSLQAVVNLCRSIDTVSSYMESDRTVLHGLDVILMSTPPPVFSREDKLKFTEVIKWAVLSSVRLKVSKEQEGKECIVSKILRWVTASIIIGRISNLSLKSLESFHKKRMQNRSLDSLIRYMMEGDSEAMEDCGVNETLGAMILYLQQIVGRSTCDNASSIVLCLSILLANSSSDSAIYDGINVRDNLMKSRGEIAALCSKILCPAETNPSWRWSYYQAWRDVALEQTEMEKLEEDQSCQSLFILFSNAFGPANFGLPVLSCNDLHQLGLFEWERCRNTPTKGR
ncbi:Nucleolar pre-ribosomal-associated protein 1 [Rhynchospora pubera]|uniref:Nucleolar pre-ribosomal-associated protein 1 n=1 Tax=Rhynchospora pubera TaxID=906938 RepID=A0AAV8DZF0_9POAL|nr:Nucleolar pre-ribosomal-associated protein 1 [Rhynchospora pubera]